MEKIRVVFENTRSTIIVGEVKRVQSTRAYTNESILKTIKRLIHHIFTNNLKTLSLWYWALDSLLIVREMGERKAGKSAPLSQHRTNKRTKHQVFTQNLNRLTFFCHISYMSSLHLFSTNVRLQFTLKLILNILAINCGSHYHAPLNRSHPLLHRCSLSLSH